MRSRDPVHHQCADGQHREHDDQDRRQPALYEMQQIVADDRDADRQQHQKRIPEQRPAGQHDLQCFGGQNDVEYVEAAVDEHGRGERQDRPARAELGPRLNHLRQAQPRPLVGMKRHEEGAESGAQHDREHAPADAKTHRRPDKTGHHCREHKIAGEPERALVPNLAVALGLRHIIDRAYLDHPAAARRRRAVVF
ncbi:MAG TPA: hypothetical protein VFJ08_14090 [Salinisphaera sp.]|nr:hypothetical protein [Salinisphaera sp.]HET7315480.1 hypothetical protein [Salinisphaera sp.]